MTNGQRVKMSDNSKKTEENSYSKHESMEKLQYILDAYKDLELEDLNTFLGLLVDLKKNEEELFNLFKERVDEVFIFSFLLMQSLQSVENEIEDFLNSVGEEKDRME